jgi:hypothetical protein
MAIGKISGQMLQSNLDRTGAGDLSIQANLIYAATSTYRVGVGTTTPNYTLDVNGNVHAGNLYILGNTITSDAGLKVNLGPITNVQMTGGSPNYVVYTDGSGNLNFGNLNYLAVLEGFTGNTIQLGTNALGSLVSNAVTMTTTTDVTDAISQLNYVLGKLVPPAPPNFPNAQTLSVSGTSTYRMTSYTQTDNSGWANLSVAAGTVVSTVLRSSSWATSSITNVGPGTTGTVTAYFNNSANGAVTLTGSNANTTNGDLYVYNVEDYHNIVSTVTAGFWSVFSASANGTATQGWNSIRIADSSAGTTGSALWFYDSSAPGVPQFTSPTIANSSNVVIYSTGIPHYTSSAGFTLTYQVNRLSGNMYPTTDTFATGTSGGAFQAPASVTYETAGITVPLAQNLYVASGTASVTTTANIVSGFGSSSSGPTVSVSNSYNTGTQTFNPGVTVLYKTGTSNTMEETNIPVSSSLGGGYSTAGVRIMNPDAGFVSDNPGYNGLEATFVSATSTVYVTDATVSGGLLKFDQTNYSTGYLPVGPNYSSHSSTQYFTFKFQRTIVSKFNIAFTGSLAGLWVALPGVTDASYASPTNGWVSMATAYAGSGVPGTGTGGNGSVGCALGGTATLNTSSTYNLTATFGTVSSSASTSNEIYVRIKLTSGQSISALSIGTPTN